MSLSTDNKYLAVHNVGLIQRQAGVDRDVAELVVAFARLRVDAGRPIDFYNEEAPGGLLAPSLLTKWLVDRNPGMDQRFVHFLELYSRTMSARKLPVILNVAHLARKLSMSEQQLRWTAFNQDSFYSTFTIPKAQGGKREIQAPSESLMRLQRWIARRILAGRKVHKFACGFVMGRSIVTNARPHIGRKVVVRVDIKDFFPSISHRQVRRVFEELGYPYRVAVMLANMCTLHGRLPQGAPTSPILSNLVCFRLDKRFTGLKKKLGFRYSRYADDIIVSSDNPKFPSLIPFFKQILREEGFVVNEDKLRVMYQGRRQTVTGLVVNRKLSLSRERVRQLRAAVDRSFKAGPESIEIASRRAGDHDPVNVLRGHLSFLGMIDRAKADSLKQKADV